MKTTKFSAIEKYFTGKSLQGVQAALAVLELALADNRWPKGASRRVPAALNKFSSAVKAMAKAARVIEENYDYEFAPGLTGRDDGPRSKWNVIYFGLQYGGGAERMEQAIEFLNERLGSKMTADEKKVIEFAAEFAAAFKPVYDAIVRLNNLRPAPVFVMGGSLSATVTKTIQEWGLKPETVRMPEIKWTEVKYVDEKGRERTKMVGTIVWPKGTKHRASRFANGVLLKHCEACGHAIKNAFNWLPLLIDNPKGVPHSFWVGRDCAKNLFNVDMEGDAEYLNREEA